MCENMVATNINIATCTPALLDETFKGFSFGFVGGLFVVLTILIVGVIVGSMFKLFK